MWGFQIDKWEINVIISDFERFKYDIKNTFWSKIDDKMLEQCKILEYNKMFKIWLKV